MDDLINRLKSVQTLVEGDDFAAIEEAINVMGAAAETGAVELYAELYDLLSEHDPMCGHLDREHTARKMAPHVEALIAERVAEASSRQEERLREEVRHIDLKLSDGIDEADASPVLLRADILAGTIRTARESIRAALSPPHAKDAADV